MAVIGLSLATAWVLRRMDLEGLLRFSGGAFAERAYLMSLGLEMILEHPLLGLGWQASALRETATDPAASQLSFPFSEELVQHFTTLPERTSVHNMYVQTLTELGLIGVLLFCLVVIMVWRSAARALRRHPAGTMMHSYARFFTLSLLLICWTSSALFPGQVETVPAMVFVGGSPLFAASCHRLPRPWRSARRVQR